MAEDYKALDKEYIVNVYNRIGAVLDHGKGAILYDVEGKKYIDLSAGIAVNIFGVCDDEWTQAVETQLHKLSHISNVFYTEPQTILAEKLCQKTGMKKVFFSNSGAEANECAIKTARKYSHDKYGDGRHTIITLKNSFHGRTLATLTACGQDSLHQDFGPFVDGFVYAEADNFDDVKHLCETNQVCAIMMEMVQGEGGVHPLDKNFVKEVEAYAKAHDILIVVDEVQTGNGRTGYLYAIWATALNRISSRRPRHRRRPAPGRNDVCRFDGEDLDRPYPRLDLWRQPDLHGRRHFHHRPPDAGIDGRSTEKRSVYQRRIGTVPTRRPRLRHGLMIGIALRIKTE